MKALLKLVLITIFSFFVISAQGADVKKIESLVDYANSLPLSKICNKIDFTTGCQEYLDNLETRKYVQELTLNLLISGIPKDVYNPLLYQLFTTNSLPTAVYYTKHDILNLLLVGETYGYNSPQYETLKSDYLKAAMVDRMLSYPSDRIFSSFGPNGNWVFSKTFVSGSCSIYGIQGSTVCRTQDSITQANKIIMEIYMKEDLPTFQYNDCTENDCKKGILGPNSSNVVKIFAKKFGLGSKITQNSVYLFLMEALSEKLGNDQSFTITTGSIYTFNRIKN